MKSSLKISFVILILLPVLSYAEDQIDDIFLHLDTGASFSKDLGGNYNNNIGNALILGIGAKYQAATKLKLGTSLTYRTPFKYTDYVAGALGTEMQKITISSWMLTASYDLVNFKDKVTLYPEVGIGASLINLGNFSVVQNSNGATVNGINGKNVCNFTWSLGAGSSFKINQTYSVDASYRYVNFGRVSTASPMTDVYGKIATNEFVVSLRMKL